MASKEVAKKESTSLAVGGFDYEEDSGTGFEDTRGSDLSIPFINILQSNSPEVEDENIGARPGQMINTVTGELIKSDEGFVFLPVHKEEAWVEWVPRTKGGGFVGMHDPTGEVVKEVIRNNGGGRIPAKGSDGKRMPFTVNGNELIETYYMYGLLLNEEGTHSEGFTVISFKSTQIKPYKDFLTSMYLIKGKNGKRPPIFANRARFRTTKQSNDSGSYYNYAISPLKETWAASLINPKEERSLYDEARAFLEMVKNGVARADFQQQSDTLVGGKGEADGDDEVPF